MKKKLAYRFALFLASLVPLSASGPPNVMAQESSNTPISISTLSVMSQNDAPKQEFPWGWIRWLMDSKIDKQATMTFGVVEIAKGKDNPLHMHPNCEEYLYVVSGSCEHLLGDKTVVLKKGDVIRIPQNAAHKAKAVGDGPCKAIIVYNTPKRQITMLEEGGEQ